MTRARNCSRALLPVALIASRETSVCIVSFLDSLVDTSQSRLRVRAHGHAVSQFNGAVFDGDGDYITIQNVPYAANGDFSVSFWFTKELCTGGIYEYLFSHHHDSSLH